MIRAYVNNTDKPAVIKCGSYEVRLEPFQKALERVTEFKNLTGMCLSLKLISEPEQNLIIAGTYISGEKTLLESMEDND